MLDPLLFSSILDGAVAGFVATVFMTLFEAFFWKSRGWKAVLEWQVNWAIFSRLFKRRSSTPKLSWSLASHLFHGTVAGIFLGLILPSLSAFLSTSLVVLAVAYSLVLWLIFSVLLREPYERAGINVATVGVVVALLSHTVYGIVLGLLI